MGTGDNFLLINPAAQRVRASLNKWDLLRLRSFCKARDPVPKKERQPTDCEKIFTNPITDKGLISKIYKEIKKLDCKRLINPIINGALS